MTQPLSVIARRWHIFSYANCLRYRVLFKALQQPEWAKLVTTRNRVPKGRCQVLARANVIEVQRFILVVQLVFLGLLTSSCFFYCASWGRVWMTIGRKWSKCWRSLESWKHRIGVRERYWVAFQPESTFLLNRQKCKDGRSLLGSS